MTADERTPISRYFASRLGPLVIVVWFIIALVTPSIYYTLEVRRVAKVAGAHALTLAESVANLAAESPGLWKYQATKYSQILHSFVSSEKIANIFVLDESGKPVSQYAHSAGEDSLFDNLDIKGPSAPIMLNNRRIGQIEVSLSIDSILLRTFYFLLASLITGTGLAIMIYRIPLNIVSGLEKQILDYQGTLEQRVEQRTLALKESTEQAQLLSEQAQSANRAKSQFLANMSHEIRTPMNGVLGMTEILLNSGLSERQQKMAKTLYGAGETLLNVINDILDFSKVEAGKLDLNCLDFDLRALVEEAAGAFSQQAGQKGLELDYHIEVEGPIPVRGDPSRLKQILSNLLGNAVKFTERGKISLHTAIAKEHERSILFAFDVRDTGIGIPYEAQEDIFESFSQADGTMTRRYGGTGLGLAICKQLCHLMSGEISVESSPGEGSTFKFTVLLRKQRAVRSPAYTVNSEGHAGTGLTEAPSSFHGHVLLAEDNLVNQEVAKSMLELLGLRVDLAENGLEALEAIASNSYDLVLMDCQMPDMDGFKATSIIRHTEAARGGYHMPIIALTGLAMEGDREVCLSAGMDDYLCKPFNLDSLRTILQKWLAQSGSK
ncbi:MAG: ATP-binding protein [Syntrophobacteraceae bacterium]